MPVILSTLKSHEPPFLINQVQIWNDQVAPPSLPNFLISFLQISQKTVCNIWYSASVCAKPLQGLFHLVRQNAGQLLNTPPTLSNVFFFISIKFFFKYRRESLANGCIRFFDWCFRPRGFYMIKGSILPDMSFGGLSVTRQPEFDIPLREYILPALLGFIK